MIESESVLCSDERITAYTHTRTHTTNTTYITPRMWRRDYMTFFHFFFPFVFRFLALPQKKKVPTHFLHAKQCSHIFYFYLVTFTTSILLSVFFFKVV